MSPVYPPQHHGVLPRQSVPHHPSSPPQLLRLPLDETDREFYSPYGSSRCALLPLHSDTLAQRHALEVAQAFDHPMFRYARQFAAADVILVGAPYWEYQFPALLRCYVEHISVSGLTFAYGEDGRPHGLCKGDRLFYLTTAGGPILDRNCGFDYLKTLLGNMMDFKKMDYVAAECTDVIGYPVEEELQKAEEQVRAQIQSWR